MPIIIPNANLSAAKCSISEDTADIVFLPILSVATPNANLSSTSISVTEVAYVWDSAETVLDIEQKGSGQGNTLVSSDTLYYWNKQTNYTNYTSVVNASKVIAPINPIDSTYLASAQDIIDRAEDVANPSLGTIGGMQLIYQDGDPIANPYNLAGFIITTDVGDVVINKIKAI